MAPTDSIYLRIWEEEFIAVDQDRFSILNVLAFSPQKEWEPMLVIMEQRKKYSSNGFFFCLNFENYTDLLAISYINWLWIWKYSAIYLLINKQ